ncbi:S8 family serine peptidase [Frateuria terrea]|uniref:Subtilase family protein n=1 Tax=Frateuria terrea TaxID=529704 RepID=A0A1H6WYJ1_9GAMM|nr:S8 family serine peptidase [Frateuria terrea]SEJ17552.1 Subtilase family protein [Frateuria terrea]SFP56469.1 Subtilase family protein [Frateuria terrea]
MKAAALLLVVFALGLAACAPVRPTVAQAAASGTAKTDVASMDSGRDIVLAVANPIEPPAMHAGSSLLGYAAPAHYGAGRLAATTLDALRQHYGWREVAGWPIKALKLYCIVLRPPPGTSREAMLQALGRDARVALAEPLHEYDTYADPPPRAQHYNDPYAQLQRGFVETDAALAHSLSQGQGARIAVVDTGVDVAHPELQGHIRAVQNLVDEDTRTFRGDRHGTEVAGIIAATGNNHQGIVGIAPDAAIGVYKACWYAATDARGARCNSFTLAKALAAVLDTDARIVNLSLGGPADPLLGQLLGQLLEQGRIVVAALPPGGSLGGFPDSKPGVLVVRMTADTAAPPGVLSAPGHDILSTEPGGGYDFSSGSSMAAAHVSGIVALLLSLDPRLSADEVRRLLLASSKRTAGGLQVDAAAAVARLQRVALATR